VKFSHEYRKFPPGLNDGDTILLEVLNTIKAELSERFLVYDTEFEDGEGGYYELPDGPLIVLLLLTRFSPPRKPVLWTTVRRSGESKNKYYCSLRGKTVPIEITLGKEEIS